VLGAQDIIIPFFLPGAGRGAVRGRRGQAARPG
jgi:hypothetical protein